MNDDDLFGGEFNEEEADALGEGLLKVILDYVMENRLPGEFASQVLISAAMSLTTGDYFSETTKPSVAGLRNALDRFRKEVDESIREAKRHADELLADFQEAAEKLGETGPPSGRT